MLQCTSMTHVGTMSSNVFVSYANPSEQDLTQRALLNCFFDDLGSRLAALNGTEKRKEIVFRDCESIPPSTPDYDKLLEKHLNNCAVGVVLLGASYLSPAKQYCYWEFQQLYRRALEVAANGDMTDEAKPKVLYVIQWGELQNALPREFPQKLQRVNHWIAESDDERLGVQYVVNRTLSSVVESAGANKESKFALQNFMICLARSIYTQCVKVRQEEYRFRPVEPYSEEGKWSLAAYASNAAKAPNLGLTPDRKRIIYSVVAAECDQVDEVNVDRHFRYEHDGLADWRPFAEKKEADLAEPQPSPRVRDIVDSISQGNALRGEFELVQFTPEVFALLRKYAGRYPVVLFVDPWTIHKIEVLKMRLAELTELPADKVGAVVAILAWNDHDEDLFGRDQQEIDRTAGEMFKGKGIRSAPASSLESVEKVVVREVKLLRDIIRETARPAIVRVGTPKPTVNAAQAEQ